MTIKRSKVNSRNNVIKVLSIYSNVIDLIKIFNKDNKTYIIYEQINISLRLINSISKLR